MESSVEFEAVDFPHANRLTVHVLAAVAEHEARMISERTKAALSAARRRGVKLGGYRGRPGTAADCATARNARSKLALRRSTDLVDAIAAARSNGATTLRQIADALSAQGIPTPRQLYSSPRQAHDQPIWRPEQVRRIILRSEGGKTEDEP